MKVQVRFMTGHMAYSGIVYRGHAGRRRLYLLLPAGAIEGHLVYFLLTYCLCADLRRLNGLIDL